MKDASRCGLRRSIGQNLQMAHFVANRCNIPGLGITTHRELGLEKAVNSLGQPVRPMEWGLRRAELKTAVKRAFDATRRTNARTDVHSIEV